MSARNIGDLLTEFTPRRRPELRSPERVVPFEPRGVRPGTAPTAPQPEPPPTPPASSAQSKLDEAYERGKKDGQAAAVADCENKLREYGLVSARRRAEERERWVAEQSSVLASRFQEAWSALEAELADTIARLLEPFIDDALRRQAVKEFVTHLEAVMHDCDHPVLCVGGPADLLDAIKSQIADGAVALQYLPQSSGEVRLVTERAVLETQMRVWTDRLAQAIA